MPQISNPFSAPEWDSVDASVLRAFIQTPTGKKFVHRLRNDLPDIELESYERAALSGAERAGAERTINRIFEYLVEEVAKDDRSEVYPDLDRDEVWGPSLQPAAFRVGGIVVDTKKP